MAKTEQVTKTTKKGSQAAVSSNGSRLDTSFIGQPHEWDPRRLYSQTGADWQYRVDFDRLRKERLEKLQAEMAKQDLGALVLFAGANIRYATASYQGNWKYNINIRYAVVPHRAASPFSLKRPVRICSAPRSTCRGWRAAFVRRSPGSGRRAPCRTWPGAWRIAWWKC